MATTAVTSRDLLTMLRRHYVPDDTRPAGVFAEEIQAPLSTRRADLIWWGCTAASGRELIGHEVKVTRADLVAELDDATKSDPWQRHCDRWFLVLPDASLADGLQLPPTWGLLTPPSGRRTRSMTVHTKAPKLTPGDQSPAFKVLTNWLHWRYHRLDLDHRHQREIHQRVQRELEELRHASPAHHSPRLERETEVALRIVRGMGGATHDGKVGGWNAEVDVETVVAVLKDVAAARHLVDYARQQLDGARIALRATIRQATNALKETEIPAVDPTVVPQPRVGT